MEKVLRLDQLSVDELEARAGLEKVDNEFNDKVYVYKLHDGTTSPEFIKGTYNPHIWLVGYLDGYEDGVIIGRSESEEKLTPCEPEKDESHG